MVFSDVSDTCYLRAIFASILFPGFFQFQLIGSVEPRGQPCTRRKLHPLFNLRLKPFLLRTCAVKKGGNETNIRKEPATCRNFQQVHWLCVWQLALFLMAFYSRLFLYVDYCCVFTLRAKNRQVSRHRIRADFCPGFVVADRAIYPTVFYHVFSFIFLIHSETLVSMVLPKYLQGWIS